MIQRIKDKDNVIGVYVRVSTDEQAKKGFSVKDQRIKLEEVITRNEIGGVDNTNYYIDDGYTGTTMNRPAFKRLLADIKKGKINLVLAVDAERLLRESEYNSFWLKYLQAYQCELFLLEDPSMDVYTDTGVLQYQIKSAFSEYEVKKIRKRAEAGITRSFLEGNYASPFSPYGYDKVEGKLFINEKEAEAVRLVHELFIDKDMSILAVSAYMNLHKINDIKWSESRIRKLLYNRVYMGEVYRRDLEQIFYGVAPVIISPEVKEKTFDKLASSTRNTLSSSKHIYIDKVYCSSCSNRCICDTHYRGERVYRYYLCKECNQRINESDITRMIALDMMDELIKPLEEESRKKARRKITEFRRRQESLLEMRELDVINMSTFNAEMKRLANDKTKYFEKHQVKYNCKIDWESLSIKAKRTHSRKLIDNIEVNLKDKRIASIKFK